MRVSACVLALAGCVGDGDRVEVTEANALGVTALEVGNADGVFRLRAFAGEAEVASVQRTTGTIPDVARVLPGSDRGSELVLAAGDAKWRSLTHETRRFVIQPDHVDPSIATFLAIRQVSPLLAEAGIVVAAPAAPQTERPYLDQALSCNPDHLNTTPTAGQCCEQWSYDYEWTLFIRASDNNAVQRYANPYHLGCTAADGTSSCNGSDCYYGPNGFARADVIDTYGGEYAHVYAHFGAELGDYHCDLTTYPATDFGDVNGNFPTGQTCPGGNGGDSPDWDY